MEMKNIIRIQKSRTPNRWCKIKDNKSFPFTSKKKNEIQRWNEIDGIEFRQRQRQHRFHRPAVSHFMLKSHQKGLQIESISLKCNRYFDIDFSCFLFSAVYADVDCNVSWELRVSLLLWLVKFTANVLNRVDLMAEINFHLRFPHFFLRLKNSTI